MKTDRKWYFITIEILSFILIIIAFIFIPFLSIVFNGGIYETSNINNYGKITGNFHNDVPNAFIFSFFPDEIEDSFSQIDYHYLAKKGDTYAYECYLEFVIQDPTDYTEFLNGIIERDMCLPFVYDESFKECSISNVLDLETQYSKGVYSVGTAEIGKILFSDNEQRIIFVAIGMYDGGGADTSELGYFFTRFEIDPWEYEQNAYATPYYQDLGVLNKDM